MSRARAGLIIGGALLLALSMWYYVEGILIPGQVSYAAQNAVPRGNLSDLYPRWWGAHELLLHGRDPYSPAVTQEIQVGYYGRPIDPARPGDPKDEQGFAYPVYVALLLAPTLALDFPTLQLGFVVFLLVLTGASVLIWSYAIRWRASLTATLALILLTLGSFPTLQGVYLQQLSLLVGGLLAGSAAALVAGRPIVAGVLLALATIKPQVSGPLIAWLALWTASDWRQRQVLAWSFGATMGLLLGGAEIVAPGWIGRFRDALADYQRYTGGISLLDTMLRSVLPAALSAAGGLLLTLALCGALAVVCWRVRRQPAGTPGFALALALVPAVTLLIIPTWAPYNQVLLLPGILLLLHERVRLWGAGRGTRYLYLIAWFLVAWPWMATLGLMLGAAILPLRVIQPAAVLPLLTSLFIPFGVLAALAALAVQMRRPAGAAVAR